MTLTHQIRILDEKNEMFLKIFTIGKLEDDSVSFNVLHDELYSEVASIIEKQTLHTNTVIVNLLSSEDDEKVSHSNNIDIEIHDVDNIDDIVSKPTYSIVGIT